METLANQVKTWSEGKLLATASFIGSGINGNNVSGIDSNCSQSPLPLQEVELMETLYRLVRTIDFRKPLPLQEVELMETLKLYQS